MAICENGGEAFSLVSLLTELTILRMSGTKNFESSVKVAGSLVWGGDPSLLDRNLEGTRSSAIFVCAESQGATSIAALKLKGIGCSSSFRKQQPTNVLEGTRDCTNKARKMVTCQAVAKPCFNCCSSKHELEWLVVFVVMHNLNSAQVCSLLWICYKSKFKS